MFEVSHKLHHTDNNVTISFIKYMYAENKYTYIYILKYYNMYIYIHIYHYHIWISAYLFWYKNILYFLTLLVSIIILYTPIKWPLNINYFSSYSISWLLRLLIFYWSFQQQDKIIFVSHVRITICFLKKYLNNI